MVTANEIQPEFARLGWILNRLQGLDHQVRYVVGDFLKLPDVETDHDAAIAQLSFLHIADKKTLFAQTNKSLREGAFLYIEDFFLRFSSTWADLSTAERDALVDRVSVPSHSLMTKQQYTQLLSEHGFELQSWEEKTTDWSRFVWERLENFLLNLETLEEKHGPSYVLDAQDFFSNMAFLYHHQFSFADGGLIDGDNDDGESSTSAQTTCRDTGTQQMTPSSQFHQLLSTAYPLSFKTIQSSFNMLPRKKQTLGGVTVIARKVKSL